MSIYSPEYQKAILELSARPGYKLQRRAGELADSNWTDSERFHTMFEVSFDTDRHVVRFNEYRIIDTNGEIVDIDQYIANNNNKSTIKDLSIDEISDEKIVGSFKINDEIIGFCFYPTNTEDIWIFTNNIPKNTIDYCKAEITKAILGPLTCNMIKLS